MHDKRRARLIAYGVAVLAVGLSLCVRWPLMPFMGYSPYLHDLLPGHHSQCLSRRHASPGSWPRCSAPSLSTTSSSNPTTRGVLHDQAEAYALGLFVLIGVGISVLGESLLRSQRRLAASRRRYAVTLASIGDAVIATDNQARVNFLNPAAEALTGWPPADALGRPLTEVFRIVNEQTRQPVEDPAAKVLRLGTVVGLANHTALLARDGRETPIDDSGAPILDDRGGIAGVVLVFRDVSQRRRAEQAEVLRRANEVCAPARRGSAPWSRTPRTSSASSTPRARSSTSPRRSNVCWDTGRRTGSATTSSATRSSTPTTGRPSGRSSTTILSRPGPRSRPSSACGTPTARGGTSRPSARTSCTTRPSAGSSPTTATSPSASGPRRRCASERRFRVFVDHAADAFFLHDQDDHARVLDVNRRASESLGYTRDELIGMTPSDFDPDFTPAQVGEVLHKIKTETTITFHSRHRRKDGTNFPVEIQAQGFQEGGRQFVVTLGVTGRHRAEAGRGGSCGRRKRRPKRPTTPRTSFWPTSATRSAPP